MTARAIRVLWTANIVLPAVAEELGLEQTPFGGWLSQMTRLLANRPDFEVGVAMRAPVPGFRRVERDGVSYFAVPESAANRFDVRQEDCERVLREFAPDILHAEGCEMAYTRRFLASWAGPRLLSLQGVINGYEPYELGRLPIAAMLNPVRPRRMLIAIALLINKQFRFNPRLKGEREAIGMVEHVMGRTLWDRAQAQAINPRAIYHHCSRVLRDPFYQKSWSLEQSEHCSIFIGNAASPRKGAHIALRAVAMLRESYPSVRVYIAGESPAEMSGSFLRRQLGYPAYLRELISDLGIASHVCFTGLLDGPAMADRMCRSRVFLLPSLIENSPNTLGEAMLMGMPVVSAYAGGVPSMASDEEDALLYRADDPAMLAHQLHRLFDSPHLCERMSLAARERASRTHDRDSNLDALLRAYDQIMADAGGGKG